MTPRTRALLGAGIGAVAVLIAHPATRPGMLAAFRPIPAGGLTRLLARPPLERPHSLDSAAAYLHAGAEKLLRNAPLSVDERQTMIEIARQGELREPDNPFWPMAAFAFHRGGGAEARAAWKRASRCKRYFDHQRAELLADRDRIAREIGDVQAWAYAAIAPQRSHAMVDLIRSVSLRTLRSIASEQEHLQFAYETIRNGAMIRDGSERLELGQVGIAMIERATDPRTLAITTKGSDTLRLWIAKTTFTASLRASGRVADARYCDAQFRTNDSWQAFRDVESPDDRFNALAVTAVQADAVPGALLATSLGGGVIWIFGRRLSSLAYHNNRFRGSGLTACSLGLLVAGILLGYPIVGMAAGACALIPALGPDRSRRFDGQSLGPLHVLVVGCIALSLGASLVLATVARSLPGALLPTLGPLGAVLSEPQRWGAVAIVVLGASAFAPPAWAMVRRYPTPSLAAYTYLRLGQSIAIIGLALAVITSPVALAIDRWLGNSLAEIALNEQNAYSPSNGGTP